MTALVIVLALAFAWYWRRLTRPPAYWDVRVTYTRKVDGRTVEHRVWHPTGGDR